MIGLRIAVPITALRKAMERQYRRTEVVPPPATVYGCLLSLVGENDRRRHLGVRVTAGRIRQQPVSTVLRTFWRAKSSKSPMGEGLNSCPDLQELVTDSEFVLWCDSGEEVGGEPTLEHRVTSALLHPEQVERYGGWSLGDSTGLINDAALVVGELPAVETFLVADRGRCTLPTWVDHLEYRRAGERHRNRWAVGDLVPLNRWPAVAELAPILP